MKKVTVQQMPESLKSVAITPEKAFGMEAEIYECDNMLEIIKVNKEDPLEMTVLNQYDKNGRVERHFFVGCGLDLDFTKPAVQRRPPRLYYAEMSDKQFAKYKDIVEKRLLNHPEKFAK